MGPHRRYLFVVLAAAVVAAMLPAQVGAVTTVTPVTDKLDSPRGIAFSNGKLFVAEAGHGGSNCFSPPGAPPSVKICIGGTGQISRVNSDGTHTPLVTGLFSVRIPSGEVIGVSGLSASEERLLAQIGATSREAPPNFPFADQAGQLISVRSNGSWTKVAPVGNFDFDYTTQFTEPTPGVYSPGTQEHDANPYGVLATDDGAYVADAGANTLDRIGEEGNVKILVHDGWRDPNPNRFPTDSVPTCVVRTSGGFLVGELSGRVIKVTGTTFSVVNVPLLTHVTGCTSDGRGNVYFVDMFGGDPEFVPGSPFFNGNVVKYNTRSGQASMLVDGLRFPNMDTIGPDGNLYVTVGSVCPPVAPAAGPCAGYTGGVVKITLPHTGEND